METGIRLEYDLYYMKHMSLFLDLFILLDTVRIVLRGGMKGDAKDRLPRYEAIWFFRVFGGAPLPTPADTVNPGRFGALSCPLR